MKIIQRIDDIEKPFKNAVVTIGNFDGVHIGHQALFHEVIDKAESIGGTAVAMTFEPHPVRVLTQNGHPPLITLYEQKLELIQRAGLDVVICVPFTMDFAAISAEAFLKEILIEKIGMKAMVVGMDYAFGKNREGNIDFLRAHAQKLGYELMVAGWIQCPGAGGGRISSTRIREFVSAGLMDQAKSMLGRFYQIRGVVGKGRNRGGRILGIPTANIVLQDELAPKNGVYAVTVEHENHLYKGVANIGFSPTFGDGVYTVEVHIFDFSSNIYGKKIRVNFVRRIRDEKKFGSIDELKQQIEADKEVARGILAFLD